MTRRLRGLCLLWSALNCAAGTVNVLTISDPVPNAIFLAWALLGAGCTGFLLAVNPTEPSPRKG